MEPTPTGPGKNLTPASGRLTCPDGGRCHHLCGTRGCFRVRTSGPLSEVFPGDVWPEDVRTRELAPEEDMSVVARVAHNLHRIKHRNEPQLCFKCWDTAERMFSRTGSPKDGPQHRVPPTQSQYSTQVMQKTETEGGG